MRHDTGLTEKDFADLVADRVRIAVGRAELRVANMAFGSAEREPRFLMEGPSGRHSLLVAATDRARLQAHWATFAAHPSNQN